MDEKTKIITPEEGRLLKKRAKAKAKKKRYKQKKGEYLTILEVLQETRLKRERVCQSVKIQYEKTITWLQKNGHIVVPLEDGYYWIWLKKEV